MHGISLKIVALAFTLGAILVALLVLPTLSRPCAEKCNVILIMVDTLSAKHLATYGYTRDTFPKTTAFFEKGTIFDNAFSNAPWTLPSFNSMYFSDIATNITYADLENGSRENLIGELRANGVKVRAVMPEVNFFIFDAISRLYHADELRETVEGESTFDAGAEELQKLTAGDTPFFLLLHTFQAHDPYQPHAPHDSYFGESDEFPIVTREQIISEFMEKTPDPKRVEIFRLRYDQQIAQVDEYIAKFLNNIPESVLKETVIVLTADHGEAFNEHGLLFHANTLFAEELHVPLMMRVPGVSSMRIKDPVSLLDIAPTLLSFAGVGVPKTFIGLNVSPLLSGGTLGERVVPSVNGRPYYMKFWLPKGNAKPFADLKEAGALGSERPIIDETSVGVLQGSERFFYENGPLGQKGMHWYDLSLDPEEKNNLIQGSNPTFPKNLDAELRKISVQEIP